MLRRFLILALTASTTALSLPAYAESEHLQRIDGESFKERQIIWIFKHRVDLLRSCLNDVKVCIKADGLREPLLKTAEAVLAGSATQVAFVRESENPELFRTGGSETHRIAVTGSKPGSRITFNRDRLDSLNLESITAILFHELAHHAGFSDDAHRIPDQVGSRLATHLRTQLLVSRAEEASSLFEVGIFRQAARDVFGPSDVKNPRFNFAYVTDGDSLIDIALALFTTEPECDARAERAVFQLSEPPVWTYGEHGIVMVSTLRNACFDPNLPVRGGFKLASRSFNLSVGYTKQGRVELSSLNVALRRPNAGDSFEKLRTARLIEGAFVMSEVQPGDVLTYRGRISMLNGNVPSTCQLGFTHPSWPQQSKAMPTMNKFDSCSVKAIDARTYEFEASFRIQAGLMNGAYNLAFVWLATAKDPSMIDLSAARFKVVGSTDAAPAITRVTFPRLTPVARIGQQALQNSAIYNPDERFEIVIDVRTTSAIVSQAFDLGVGAQIGSELETLSYVADVSDLKMFFSRIKSERIDGGFRLKVQTSIPAKLEDKNVFFLALRRILLRDEAGNWMGIQFPDYDHMILREDFVATNAN